jgi:hypothetical protein
MDVNSTAARACPYDKNYRIGADEADQSDNCVENCVCFDKNAVVRPNPFNPLPSDHLLSYRQARAGLRQIKLRSHNTLNAP